MTKYPLGTYWTGVALLIFMLGSSLPNSVLKMACGNVAGHAVLIGLVLYSSLISVGALLSTFMAVAVLYVEYRQRVLMRVITTRSEPSKEEEPPVDLKLSEGGEQYRTVNEKREIPTIRGPNSQEVAFYKSHGLA